MNDRPSGFPEFTLKDVNSIHFALARLDLIFSDCICIWFKPLQILDTSFHLCYLLELIPSGLYPSGEPRI